MCVDDDCFGKESPVNKSVGVNEDDVVEVHDGVDVDTHLDDAQISVESIEVQVEDLKKCEEQGNTKERVVQSEEDLENPIGTSVSEIVCKCLKGTYDLATPLSYKERFGVQTQEVENIEGTSKNENVSKSKDGSCDNIGKQANADEDSDLIGMILSIANESCEIANVEQEEQLKVKENLHLEEKENEAKKILVEFSVEKTEENLNKTVMVGAVINEDNLNQYSRKRKRDSIGYDCPSFSIITPTPPSPQMSIDDSLCMEVERNIKEEECGRGKRNKKISWQLKSPFDQEKKIATSNWIKSKYTRKCILTYTTDNAKLLKTFNVWLGKEKRRGRKKETDCGAFLVKYVELLMTGSDVEKFKPEDIKDYRKELAANLWAHGEWKRISGYDTPPENVGDNYDSENESCCPKKL